LYFFIIIIFLVSLFRRHPLWLRKLFSRITTQKFLMYNDFVEKLREEFLQNARLKRHHVLSQVTIDPHRERDLMFLS